MAKISADIRTDPALARPDLVKDIPAVACVPLIVQHETIGCLMVGRRVPFREEDVRLLTAIAEMAGNALHRAGVMETLEERVHDRTHELEDANTRLQELDRLKTEFVSNVTHELRTPITNILLYLDLLRLSPAAERSAHYMDVLRSESVRLGGLIEDLLTLSRLERGAIAMEVEPHPLDALLAEVLIAQTPSAQSRGVDLSHDPNLDLPVALVSRTQILQVFTNLVANAIAYARPGGAGAAFDPRGDGGRSHVRRRTGVQRRAPDRPRRPAAHLRPLLPRAHRAGVRPARDRVGAGNLQGDRRASCRLDRGRERSRGHGLHRVAPRPAGWLSIQPEGGPSAAGAGAPDPRFRPAR